MDAVVLPTCLSTGQTTTQLSKRIYFYPWQGQTETTLEAGSYRAQVCAIKQRLFTASLLIPLRQHQQHEYALGLLYNVNSDHQHGAKPVLPVFLTSQRNSWVRPQGQRKRWDSLQT
jgi:hypothetical protein